MLKVMLFFIFMAGFCLAQNSEELFLFKQKEDEAVLNQMRNELQNCKNKSLEEIIDYLKQNNNSSDRLTYRAFMYIKHSNIELNRAILEAQMKALSKETIQDGILDYIRKKKNKSLPNYLISFDDFIQIDEMPMPHNLLTSLLSQINYPGNINAMKDFNQILTSLRRGKMGGLFLNVNDLQILNDEKIAKILIEVALEIEKKITDPLRSDAPSFHLDDLLSEKMQKYSISEDEFQKTKTTILGLYAQRGAAWAASAETALRWPLRGTALESSFLAMSYIATGISVLDKIQWQTHQKLFSLPRQIDNQSLLIGKPYYFWMSYYLARQVTHPSVQTIKAVSLLNEIYQLSANFNERDPYEILKINDKSDMHVVSRSVDIATGITGAAYGVKASDISFNNIWSVMRQKSTLPSPVNNLSFLYNTESKKYEMQNTLMDNILYHDDEITLFSNQQRVYIAEGDQTIKTSILLSDDRVNVLRNQNILLVETVYGDINTDLGNKKVYYIDIATKKILDESKVVFSNKYFYYKNKLHYFYNSLTYSFDPIEGKKIEAISPAIFKRATILIPQSLENRLLFISTGKQNPFLNIYNILDNTIVRVKVDTDLLTAQSIERFVYKSVVYKSIGNSLFIIYQSENNLVKNEYDIISGKLLNHNKLLLDHFYPLGKSLSLDASGKVQFIAQHTTNNGFEVVQYKEDLNGGFVIDKKLYSESTKLIDRIAHYIKTHILKLQNILVPIKKVTVPSDKLLYLHTPLFELDQMPASLLMQTTYSFRKLIPAKKTINKIFSCNFFFVR